MGFSSFLHSARHVASKVLGTFGNAARKVADFGGHVARKVGEFAPVITSAGSQLATMLGHPEIAAGIQGVGSAIHKFGPKVQDILHKVGAAGDTAKGIGHLIG